MPIELSFTGVAVVVLGKDTKPAVEAAQLAKFIPQNICRINMVFKVTASTEIHPHNRTSVKQVLSIIEAQFSQTDFSANARIERTEPKRFVLFYDISNACIDTDLISQVMRDEEVEVFGAGIASIKVWVVKQKLIADV